MTHSSLPSSSRRPPPPGFTFNKFTFIRRIYTHEMATVPVGGGGGDGNEMAAVGNCRFFFFFSHSFLFFSVFFFTHFPAQVFEFIEISQWSTITFSLVRRARDAYCFLGELNFREFRINAHTKRNLHYTRDII